jgi:N-acetylglucosamine kinase-like BadF-type ATPase
VERPEVTAYLGIDVGGTASRWVALDAAGTIVGRGAAAGATGHLFAEGPRAAFAAAMAEIAAAFSVRPVAAVRAGITGLGPRAHSEAKAIIAGAFGDCRVTVSDDIELAFRAVFAPGAGHLVSAGTGSIGVHLTARGETIRVGGRGILIDDGGSGSWIALTALDRLYRIIDAHGAPRGAERLAAALAAALGGDGWDDVRSFVYAGDRGKIGALARPVADAAAAGDPVALTVLADAAGELARLGHALVARGGPLPLAFVGGVLDLDPAMKPALGAAFPSLSVSFPKPDAALRAAELAKEDE